MKNISIWNDISTKKCKKVTKDMEVDTLIIGGGMTGISALYHLKKEGRSATLVERNTCGRGVTSRSTAKITFLQEKMYMRLRSTLNDGVADKYLKSQIEAMQMLKNMIDSERIECDLNEADSYIFTNVKSNVHKIESEYDFLKRNNVPAELVAELPFNEKFKKALRVSGTYVFHPLKYIEGMKKTLEGDIYEDTKVESISKEGEYYISHCGGFKIKSRRVIIATHYPFFLTPFLAPLKSHMETSYLGATKVSSIQNLSAINIDRPCISLRYQSDESNKYMIYLYRSYITSNIGSISKNIGRLKEKYDMEYIWSNKDVITNDGLPYVGSVDRDNTFLIATGYNTWGMTNGTLAGKILSDIVCERENEYIKLFSLNRHLNLGVIVRFPLDLCCSGKAYMVSNRFNSNNRNIEYRKVDGQNILVYKDEDGQEHTVLNRCPHMKCGLVFNEIEKTWDCLCHGSRYDIDGKCIEGPSNDDISFEL